MTTLPRFARRLRLVRSAMGVSREQLATNAGLHIAEYEALETGRATITAAILLRLSSSLDIAPELFFEPD